jgi:hypothetical protein
MIYPGSFIWRRMPTRWLVARPTAITFGLSSFIIIIGSIVLFRGLGLESKDRVIQVLLAIGGAAIAVSAFFLWGGMWKYWIVCDSSSQLSRRVWFVVLIIGLWYGAVLYYLFVYLPDVQKSKMHALRGIE